MALTETCEAIVTEGFIFMTLNQVVQNSKNGYFSCFRCSLRLFRLSAPSFLFLSFQKLKDNVFILPENKFEIILWSYYSITPLLIFSFFNYKTMRNHLPLFFSHIMLNAINYTDDGAGPSDAYFRIRFSKRE